MRTIASLTLPLKAQTRKTINSSNEAAKTLYIQYLFYIPKRSYYIYTYFSFSYQKWKHWLKCGILSYSCHPIKVVTLQNKCRHVLKSVNSVCNDQYLSLN